MILRLLHCVNLAADGLCALCGGDLEGDEMVGPSAFADADNTCFRCAELLQAAKPAQSAD